MRFDWAAFCRRNHIEFVTSGPNTARGNISIQCPYCGNADESQHMGLKLDVRDPQWGCFRNAQHRGKTPERLIARLLGVTYKAAQALVSEGNTPVDDYDEAVERLRRGREWLEPGVAPTRPPTIPTEFKQLLPGGFQAGMFNTYLSSDRGFREDSWDVARDAGLCYALSGEQAYRLIFPVHAADGSLAGWTGRSIAKAATIRYLTMPFMGKDVVYGFPASTRRGRRALLIVEGPMDALKLNAYGKDVHAVATMGTSFTDGQLATLVELTDWYSKTIVLSDRGAISESLMLSEQLSTYARRDIPAIQLPGSYKDPGEMPREAIERFCMTLGK